MIVPSHKSKQYGLIALKVLLLSITFGYIYQRLSSGNHNNLSQFLASFETDKMRGGRYLSGFLVLAIANWSLEALKWKTVVSQVERISFSESFKQSLASLSVSLATPNRVGEYGAKTYYFAKEKRKQILLLNLFSNLSQMAITVCFGLLGLFATFRQYPLPVSTSKIAMIVIGFIVVVGLVYVLKEKQLFIKGLTVQNVVRYFNHLSTSIKFATLLLSLCRYVVFSILFFLILNYFNAQLHPGEAFPLITSMYLLSSVIPAIFIFDVVIKGGVALWLFSFVGVPEVIVLSTVFAMWLFNFVIPAIFGSYYVIQFKGK